MNRAALQVLTWGTISAAVVSALLLAAAGDEIDSWQSDRDAESPGSAAPRGGALPMPVPLGNPVGAGPSGGSGPPVDRGASRR